MDEQAGMLKRWRFYRPQGQDDPASLARLVGVSPLIASLLLRRGICERDPASRFLSPKLAHLHDPGCLPGVRQAAVRLNQAVRDRQPIVIYGDYDVDGITASAILWHALSAAGANVQTYVPHRIDEGYGLNIQAIAQLAEGGVDGNSPRPLIVSVDCGISAIEPAQAAAEAGVDLIITDHHEFDPANLPVAHTLVHPRLAAEDGQRYPFGELCGAGVAFKLAWQFLREHCGSERLPTDHRNLVMDLLSLAALGTVADIVPLVDENRIITTYGLGQIKRTRFIGLNAMIDAASLRDEKIDAYHVGFVLGPRLNACGRMGHADRAVHLLTVADEREAAETATFLTGENDRRRATEREIFDQARQMILDANYHDPASRAIVVGSEGWHPGVIGIVASRLVEQFVRPVVMLNFDNGMAHGSARSVDGVGMHEALQHCAEHLDRFGGHAMAAGLHLRTDAVESFRAAMIQFVNERLRPEDLAGTLTVDAICNLAEVEIDLVQEVQRLAPFGRDNPAPLLCVRNVRLNDPPRRVGREGKHLSLTLRDGDAWRRAIAFGMGDAADDLAVGMHLDVVFSLQSSVWQGMRRAEMHVKDLRVVT